MAKRWRREPNETGLSRVVQSPRGFQLWDGGVKLASVNPKLAGFAAHRDIVGWYFVATPPSGRTHNSLWSDPPYQTADDAKAAALAYLKAPKGQGGANG